MAENYRAIGYEVEVREIQRTADSCYACFDDSRAAGQAFGTLFIRRTAASRQADPSHD